MDWQGRPTSSNVVVVPPPKVQDKARKERPQENANLLQQLRAAPAGKLRGAVNGMDNAVSTLADQLHPLGSQ